VANTYLNRVMMSTPTVGTGTLTVSGAITNATLGDFFTLLEAGSMDGETIPYVLWEGHNVEMGDGVIGGTGTTLTRTVTASKIGGVAGTSKINLMGSGTVMLSPLAADLGGVGLVGFTSSLNTTAPNNIGGHYVLANPTTNATPTVLTTTRGLSTGTNQILMPNGANGALGASYVFRGQIVGVDIATGHTSAWSFVGAIKQLATAASTALVAAVTPTLIAQDAALSSAGVAISADTTNGALAVTVTGIASTNINWMCDVQTSETTY
jgi:hypothetical protein